MISHSKIATAEFSALRQLSAKAGSDPLLVQGAGGNTSIKDNGILWIKASGKWLAHAEREEIFVPVELAPLLQRLGDHDPLAEKAENFVIQELNPRGLRPSIETTVHALMPHRVVVHVHCVDTIALAVQVDGDALAAERLQGLDHVFVPYKRPGLPLAKAIAERQRPGNDVLVLGNHGLVVAAETVNEAAILLNRVSGLLAQRPRAAIPHDEAALRRLAAGSTYRLPADARAHAVATDPVSCRIAAGGSLYPDHVVFLGAGSFVAQGDDTAFSITDAARRKGGEPPVCILFPGRGVLMRQDASAGADAMAGCLADVTRRLDAHAKLRYLTHAEHGELLNWDAEKYRQHLDRRDGAATP